MTKYVDGFVCAFGNQALCFESSLTASDWASWVQAVGSVCAILVSAFVVWWQVGKQHRLQVDHSEQAHSIEDLRRIAGFAQVLAHGQEQLRQAAIAFTDYGSARIYRTIGYKTADLDLTAAALERADPALLADPSLDLSFRAARKQFLSGHAVVIDTLDYAAQGEGVKGLLDAQSKTIAKHQLQCAAHTGPLNDRMAELAKAIARHR